jgi:hypothetical protein
MYQSPEVGAAAIFLAGMDRTRNSQHWRDPAVQDLLDINSLQPSQPTAPSTDFASSSSHLKAITASKRMKVGPNEIWYCSFILLFSLLIIAISFIASVILFCCNFFFLGRVYHLVPFSPEQSPFFSIDTIGM